MSDKLIILVKTKEFFGILRQWKFYSQLLVLWGKNSPQNTNTLYKLSYNFKAIPVSVFEKLLPTNEEKNIFFIFKHIGKEISKIQ